MTEANCPSCGTRFDPRSGAIFDEATPEAIARLGVFVDAMRRATAALEAVEAAAQLVGEALIDPDCRDGKHGSCAADPCDCPCHHAVEVVGSLPGVDLVSLDGSHVHYYRQRTAGLACSCGATVTT